MPFPDLPPSLRTAPAAAGAAHEISSRAMGASANSASRTFVTEALTGTEIVACRVSSPYMTTMGEPLVNAMSAPFDGSGSAMEPERVSRTGKSSRKRRSEMSSVSTGMVSSCNSRGSARLIDRISG
jgi:hypothetical protein